MCSYNNLMLYCLLCLLLFFQQNHGRDIEELCTTCRDLVGKFHEGMEKTAKNHFGGGDTAWEESRLGSYARSETRLLEILETVCKDSSKDHLCHAMVEEHEEEIENFWFKKQNQLSQLENHLCIDVVKVCCSDGKFGKKCEECPGGPTNQCFGRGKCNGNGTRGGTGQCDCNPEYTGDDCDSCSEGYYDADGNNSCTKCHDTCLLDCTNGTNKGCDDCKEGYTNDPEQGCIDKDECQEANSCDEGKFCVNNEGSFDCNDCDPACKGGCTGAGKSSCNDCNDGWQAVEAGFFSMGEGCEDIDECVGEHSCSVETYCVNSEGSHTCSPCNVACSGGCFSGDPNTCVECASGYKLGDEGCVDINECEEKNITCEFGTACVNKPGPDSCEPCHENCLGCVSTDPTGCVLCKAGFTLTEEGCTDIDECLKKPCKFEGEDCHNTHGSYKCKCKKGWVRTKKKDCKRKSKSKEKKDEMKEEIEETEKDEL